jgi:hypothetical protein
VLGELESGSLRYRLLETVRQYAAAKLVATSGKPERDWVRATHAGYYLQLAERVAPEVEGLQQGYWLKRLDTDWDNFRAAFGHFLSQPDGTEMVLRLGTALAYLIGSRCHRFGFEAVGAALARSGPVRADVRARALCLFGQTIAGAPGTDSDPEMLAGRAFMKEGLGLARALSDMALIAEVLTSLAWSADFVGEPSEAARCAKEALGIGRCLNNRRLIGLALGPLALGPCRAYPRWKKRALAPGFGLFTRNRRPLALRGSGLASRCP